MFLRRLHSPPVFFIHLQHFSGFVRVAKYVVSAASLISAQTITRWISTGLHAISRRQRISHNQLS